MTNGFLQRLRRRGLREYASFRRRMVGSRDPMNDLVRAGLFDEEFYRAQLQPSDVVGPGRRAAVAHYIAHGRSQGLAFHPFIEPEWWAGRAASSPQHMIALERDLADRRIRSGSPSPLVADVDAPVGELRDFLRDIRKRRRRVGLPEGLTLPEVRTLMVTKIRKAYATLPNDGAASGVNWEAVRRASPDRARGRVSILVPTFEDWNMTIDAVRAALSGASTKDVEVLIIDNGSRPAVFRILVAAFLTEPRVTVIRSSTNTNFSGGMNIGIARSSGEFVLLLNNDAMLEPGWLPPLISALKNPAVKGVQSLLLYPRIERVQAAGTMFLGAGVIPWHFLAGHPVEDALRTRDRRFHAITAAVMMLRASDLVDAQGFDEGYRNGYEDIDLCLRLLRDPRDHFTVAIDSRAYHPEGSSEGRSKHDTANRARFLARWGDRLPSPEGWRYTEIGLQLVALRPHTFVDDVPVMLSDPQLVRPERTVRSGAGAGLPCLRWTLCLSQADIPDELVELVRSDLHTLGQEVVSFGGGVRFADGLDDVLVAFNEGAPYTPRSATVNVLVGPQSLESEGRWDFVLTDKDEDRPYSPSVTENSRLRTLRTVIDESHRMKLDRFISIH